VFRCTSQVPSAASDQATRSCQLAHGMVAVRCGEDAGAGAICHARPEFGNFPVGAPGKPKRCARLLSELDAVKCPCPESALVRRASVSGSDRLYASCRCNRTLHLLLAA